MEVEILRDIQISRIMQQIITYEKNKVQWNLSEHVHFYIHLLISQENALSHSIHMHIIVW